MCDACHADILNTPTEVLEAFNTLKPTMETLAAEANAATGCIDGPSKYMGAFAMLSMLMGEEGKATIMEFFAVAKSGYDRGQALACCAKDRKQ